MMLLQDNSKHTSVLQLYSKEQAMKDFDYEEFQAFMRSLSGFTQAVELEQNVRTNDKIQSLDKIDQEVNNLNDLDLAKGMLRTIGVAI